MKIRTIEQAEKLGLKTHSYKNGDWKYEDTDGYEHLFRDGEELLPEIEKKIAWSYKNGDWEYKDTDGYWHFIIDGKEVLPEVKKQISFLYANGDWAYRDITNKWHTVKGNNNEN